MPFSAIFSIVALALAASLFSVEGSRQRSNINRSATAPYLRWFFTVEAFYRAFTINLSFGAISLALSLINFTSDWGFWDLNSPIIPLLINFLWGLVAAHELADDYNPPPMSKWWVIVFAVLFYLYAAIVAALLYKPRTP